MLKIKNDIPQHYLENEDTKTFIQVIQDAQDEMYSEINDLINIIDYEKAEEKFLDLMLLETGWNIDIPLTTLVKRKMIKVADELFSIKGTKEGLIKGPKYLMDLDVELFPFNDGFRLNANSLGVSTILGHTDSDYYFAIVSKMLSTEDMDTLKKIIDFMRWAPTFYDVIQYQLYYAELIPNGTFEIDISGWNSFAGAILTHENEMLKVESAGASSYAYNDNLLIEKDKIYRITLSSNSSVGSHSVKIHHPLGTVIYENNYLSTNTWHIFEFQAKTDDLIQFRFYPGDTTGDTAYFDNVSLREIELVINGSELVINKTFDLWTIIGSGTVVINTILSPNGKIEGNQLIANVNNTHFVYEDITETTGKYNYSVYLKGSGDIETIVEENGGDYTKYNSRFITLTDTWVKHDFNFIKEDDGNPFRLRINNLDTADTVYAWNPSCKEVNRP